MQNEFFDPTAVNPIDLSRIGIRRWNRTENLWYNKKI